MFRTDTSLFVILYACSLLQGEDEKLLLDLLNSHQDAILTPFGGPLSAGGDIGLSNTKGSDDEDDDVRTSVSPSRVSVSHNFCDCFCCCLFFVSLIDTRRL